MIIKFPESGGVEGFLSHQANYAKAEVDAMDYDFQNSMHFGQGPSLAPSTSERRPFLLSARAGLLACTGEVNKSGASKWFPMREKTLFARALGIVANTYMEELRTADGISDKDISLAEYMAAWGYLRERSKLKLVYDSASGSVKRINPDLGV